MRTTADATFLPPTTRWLWPTLLGSPLIALWATSDKRRSARRRAPDAAAV